MSFLCTCHIHRSRTLGYHAMVASNTPSQCPDSTPTQYSTLYPSQTTLPPHPVRCSTCTSVPILPPRPVPHLLHRPLRHPFGKPSPHAACNEPLNHCHQVLDRGRRSLSHLAPTRAWRVRICSAYVPTLRSNPPTTPTTLQCLSPRRAQHHIMSFTSLQPHSSTAHLLSRAP